MSCNQEIRNKIQKWFFQYKLVERNLNPRPLRSHIHTSVNRPKFLLAKYKDDYFRSKVEKSIWQFWPHLLINLFLFELKNL